jgi:hypothetical protein
MDEAEMDVITTDTPILRGQRRLRIYRWQTKGLMAAMSIWTRYYLPKPRDNRARPDPLLPDRD